MRDSLPETIAEITPALLTETLRRATPGLIVEDVTITDVVVDRGVVHGWHNPGPDVARMLVVNIDALPVPRADGAQDISAITAPTS